MQEFSYYRSIAPTLSVLLGLALVETMVLHIVAVALWGWTVAIVLGLLDLSLVAALVGLLRAIRRYPVTIADDMLTMRVGKFRIIPIPLCQIAGLRASWDAASLQRKSISNLALAAWPNIFVDLSAPLRIGRRDIVGVDHRLDDPAAFAAAIEGVCRASTVKA